MLSAECGDSAPQRDSIIVCSLSPAESAIGTGRQPSKWQIFSIKMQSCKLLPGAETGQHINIHALQKVTSKIIPS